MATEKRTNNGQRHTLKALVALRCVTERIPRSVDCLAVGLCSVGEQQAGERHVAVGTADV